MPPLLLGILQALGWGGLAAGSTVAIVSEVQRNRRERELHDIMTGKKPLTQEQAANEVRNQQMLQEEAARQGVPIDQVQQGGFKPTPMFWAVVAGGAGVLLLMSGKKKEKP